MIMFMVNKTQMPLSQVHYRWPTVPSTEAALPHDMNVCTVLE